MRRTKCCCDNDAEEEGGLPRREKCEANKIQKEPKEEHEEDKERTKSKDKKTERTFRMRPSGPLYYKQTKILFPQ